MQVEQLRMRRDKARELYRMYKKHQFWSKPEDIAIQRAYQRIAQGRMVIKALDSIRQAGTDAFGRPRLAIMRADMKECWLRITTNGETTFSDVRYPSWRSVTKTITLPAAFPRKDFLQDVKAMVPLVPIHMRPKRGLQNYHVLWEAEWSRIVPRDPMLLRRLGGDIWLVLASWDLTEVERAVLAGRM